jgi:outer membrane protein TolC
VVFAQGSEPPPARLDLTLRAAVEMALEQNPLSRAEQHEVEKAQAFASRVRAKVRFPTLGVGFNTGIVPEARGDIFYSPDSSSDLDGWGPFYKLDAGLFQNIFNFGKGSSAIRAARGGLEVAERSRDSVRARVAFDVAQAYLAVVWMGEAVEVAETLRESYAELVARVEEKLMDPDSTVDDADFLEVQTLAYEVERARRESTDRHRLAKRGLALLLGLDPNTLITTSQVVTPEFSVDADILADVERTGRASNADIQRLRAAVGALGAKVDLARAQPYPDIFLVGGFRWAYASNRTDQKNPFVWDDFNYVRAGAFIGLRWDLTFWEHRLAARQAQAEQDTMSKKLDAVDAKVDMELGEALTQARTSAEMLAVAHESLDSAESWLRVSWENLDLGIGEVRKLLRAYEAYFQLQAVTIERELEMNVALAHLAWVLGDEGRFLEWVDNGLVTIE